MFFFQYNDRCGATVAAKIWRELENFPGDLGFRQQMTEVHRE